MYRLSKNRAHPTLKAHMRSPRRRTAESVVPEKSVSTPVASEKDGG